MTSLFSFDVLATSDRLPESSVQHYYLMNPEGKYADLDKCRQEYWWGLQWGQLDLKTPLNTIYARSDIILLLKGGKIMISPTEETLQQMNRMQERQNQLFLRGAHADREVFTEVFPEMEYEYIIMPLKILNDKPPPSLYVHDPDTGHVERYDAPYTNLPHFRSSAHPFFIVEGSFCALRLSLVPRELKPIASLLGEVGCYTATFPPDPFYEIVYTPAPPVASDEAPSGGPLDASSLSPFSSPSNRTVFTATDSHLTPYTKRVSKWREECNPDEYEYEYSDHEVPRRLTDIDFSDCPGWTEDVASRNVLSSSDWMRLYRKGEIDVVYSSCDEMSDSDGYSDCAT